MSACARMWRAATVRYHLPVAFQLVLTHGIQTTYNHSAPGMTHKLLFAGIVHANATSVGAGSTGQSFDWVYYVQRGLSPLDGMVHPPRALVCVVGRTRGRLFRPNNPCIATHAATVHHEKKVAPAADA